MLSCCTGTWIDRQVREALSSWRNRVKVTSLAPRDEMSLPKRLLNANAEALTRAPLG
jgi:hypothetical protein